jgi:hypothetical protein
MSITPDMLTPNAVALKIADGQLTKQLDRTTEPIRFTFNAGTPGELTVRSYVLIAPHDLPETLLGMSVIGPTGLVPDSRKQRLFYYQTDAFGQEISCSVATKFPIEYVRLPLASARHAEVKAFSGSVLGRTNVSPPPKPASRPAHLASWPWIKQPVPGQGRITIDHVQMAHRRCEQIRTERRVANLEIYDRTFKVAANMTEWRSPLSTYPAYAHLKPLTLDYVDKHKELCPENPSGIVLIELFGGLLATTKAFLRNGIKIRKLYVCENDPKAREAAKFRLEAFSLIFSKLLAPDAWAECFIWP